MSDFKKGDRVEITKEARDHGLFARRRYPERVMGVVSSLRNRGDRMLVIIDGQVTAMSYAKKFWKLIEATGSTKGETEHEIQN